MLVCWIAECLQRERLFVERIQEAKKCHTVDRKTVKIDLCTDMSPDMNRCQNHDTEEENKYLS